MRVVKSVPVEDFEFRGSIKDSDVTRLRSVFKADPDIHENEADALLRLNRSCPIKAPSWRDFLVDAIADYILNQNGPEGYITSDKGGWLIGKLATDGWIANRAEFELLIAILGRARWFPLSLATFALEQVAGAAIHGYGPLRAGAGGASGQGVGPGTISEGEVALVRAILAAFGGDSALPVTRAEIDVLIGINKAVSGRPVPAAWTDLYSKALANVVLDDHGYAVPTRSAALRPWVSGGDHQSLEQQVAASLGHLRYDYSRSAEARALARLERQRIEIVTGESIVSEEPGWFMVRLALDVRRQGIEGAVLAHLSRECLIGEVMVWDGKAA